VPPELLSAFELIRQCGTRTVESKCGCRGKFTLYAVRYPDSRGTALLCSICDVELDKRQT
jgi:hypothetical protein